MLGLKRRKGNAMQNMEADNKPIDPFACFKRFFRGQFIDVDGATWDALCRERWAGMSHADHGICAELSSIFFIRFEDRISDPRVYLALLREMVKVDKVA